METLLHFWPLYILLAVAAGAIAWARGEESKEWNNGHCATCLNEWEYFTSDSQGGRGYKCKCPYRNIWITYKVDKVVRTQI